MIIRSLELKNFRNYDELNLKLHEGINIFCGDNAQGKTNILEAVYTSCTSKSQKLAKDREMIRFGCDEAHIKTFIDRSGTGFRIDTHLKKNGSKGIAVNGVPIRKASELFGIANVISFAPGDLNIIKNGPSERRRFMDMELCQLNRPYLHDLVSYNRVLNQKNKLLKSAAFNNAADEFIDIYNEQLVTYGSGIINARAKFISDLEEIIKDIHLRISGSSEELRLIYDPYVSIDDFRHELSERREQEIKNGVSLVGPHKDELIFMLNGVDLRNYGSQGQQRTAAISLKLSELKIAEQMSDSTPVLLLDDVLSELDRSRQNMLLSSISNIQTLITCTGVDDFVRNRFHIDKVFRINNGRISGEQV